VPTYPFKEVISTKDELRALIGFPQGMAVTKQLDKLEQHSRRFIEHSPFALVSSADAKGNCDVSPKGDGPGFVYILDDSTILIPDRPGNRRADTITNVIENPHVGTIFLIPDVEDTLRVNGRAFIVRDSDLLEKMTFRGKTPALAIAVEIEEVFFHCAKAFKRSNLWKPELWPDHSAIPSLARMILDQVNDTTTDRVQVECDLEVSYRKNLY
jgi:PPOX class probable FMN-dependent enzyme